RRTPPRGEAADARHARRHLEPVLRQRVPGGDEPPQPRHDAHVSVQAPPGRSSQRRAVELLVEYAGVAIDRRHGGTVAVDHPAVDEVQQPGAALVEVTDGHAPPGPRATLP